MRRGLPGVIGQPVRSHVTEELSSVPELVPLPQRKRHVRGTAHKIEFATHTRVQVISIAQYLLSAVNMYLGQI